MEDNLKNNTINDIGENSEETLLSLESNSFKDLDRKNGGESEYSIIEAKEGSLYNGEVIIGVPQETARNSIEIVEFKPYNLQTDNDIFKVGPCSDDVSDSIFSTNEQRTESLLKRSTNVVRLQAVSNGTLPQNTPVQTNSTICSLTSVQDLRFRTKLKQETPVSESGCKNKTSEVLSDVRASTSSSKSKSESSPAFQPMRISSSPSPIFQNLIAYSPFTSTPLSKAPPVNSQSNNAAYFLNATGKNGSLSSPGTNDSSFLTDLSVHSAYRKSLKEGPKTKEGPLIQRFMTSDNQIVYGWKDDGGEFHFFCPSENDRETHNEKERKRRSRVSEACCALRSLIPGVNEKTDKATVFEQTARYLKYLREKFSTDFDHLYCETHYQYSPEAGF